MEGFYFLISEESEGTRRTGFRVSAQRYARFAVIARAGDSYSATTNRQIIKSPTACRHSAPYIWGMPEAAGLTDRRWDIVAPALIAIASIAIFFRVHPAQRISFAPAMVIAFIVYMNTSYRAMPDPARVLPLYLIALALQFLHFAEEYVYGFHTRLPEALPWFPPFDENVFVVFNMIAYAIFLLAALGLYKNMKWPMIIIWFYVIAGLIGNSIWHILLSLRVGGYFPGLLTSLGGWILAPMLVKRLREGHV